jgi:hypothetical protein
VTRVASDEFHLNDAPTTPSWRAVDAFDDELEVIRANWMT